MTETEIQDKTWLDERNIQPCRDEFSKVRGADCSQDLILTFFMEIKIKDKKKNRKILVTFFYLALPTHEGNSFIYLDINIQSRPVHFRT